MCTTRLALLAAVAPAHCMPPSHSVVWSVSQCQLQVRQIEVLVGVSDLLIRLCGSLPAPACAVLQAASAELASLESARAAVMGRVEELERQLGLLVEAEEQLLQHREEGKWRLWCASV